MAFLPEIILVHSFLLLVLTSCFIDGIYYCTQNRGSIQSITGTSVDEIKTVYSSQTNYGNNYDCQWTIDVGAGKRVWIEVLKSHLQWAPGNAICTGYDYMEIRSGLTSRSKEIINWCGTRAPKYVMSEGRYLYLRFRSNDQNIYTYNGIHLRFGAFDSKSCPPISSEWSLGNRSLCITVVQENVTWTTGQEHCKWMQSNLVKVHSKQMAKFVTDAVLKNSTMKSYWIGLHDIARENKFLWIDKTKVTFNSLGLSGVEANDCVSVDTSSNGWNEKNCDKAQPGYVCSMQKGGPIILYGIPKEGDYPQDPLNRVPGWMIGVIIAGVLLLFIVLGVVIFCVVRIKKVKKNEKRSQPAEMETRNLTVNLPPPIDQTQNSNVSIQVHSPSGRIAPPAVDGTPRPGHREVTPSSSQLIAPPTYAEAINQPVFEYSPSNI